MASAASLPTPLPSPGTNISVTVQNHPVEKQYQGIFIGCLLAIIGNLLISVSLNVQKYTHNKDEKLLASERKHYLKRPIWWLGVVLMILGEIGNFGAYGFAPASVVAPLGTTTVIANMFIAVIFLREQLRPEDLFGSALAIVGAFLIVSFSKRKEHIFNATQLIEALISVRFIVYISIEVLALVILFFLLYVLKKENVLVLLLITSIIASITVICAKGVSGLLNLSMAGSSQFHHPVLYIMAIVMVATAVLQVFYLNMAMKGSDSTVVVPTNFVFFTISAIVSGIIFYNEFSGLYSLSIFMFLLGCMLSFIGVYFITFNRAPPAAAAVADATAGFDGDSGDAAASIAGADDEVALMKSSPGLEAERKKPSVLQEIFPSWLLGTVSPSEVQPKLETSAEGDGGVAAPAAATSDVVDDEGAADFLRPAPTDSSR